MANLYRNCVVIAAAAEVGVDAVASVVVATMKSLRRQRSRVCPAADIERAAAVAAGSKLACVARALNFDCSYLSKAS